MKTNSNGPMPMYPGVYGHFVISRYDGGLTLQRRRNKARLVTDSRCTGKWRKNTHTVFRFMDNALPTSSESTQGRLSATTRFLEHTPFVQLLLLYYSIHSNLCNYYCCRSCCGGCVCLDLVKICRRMRTSLHVPALDIALPSTATPR